MNFDRYKEMIKDQFSKNVRYTMNEITIDEDKLAREAGLYAEAVIIKWGNKIQEKIGELENATVHSIDTYTFLIGGTKNGHKVAIEQQCIVNQRGNELFNQFPARIYVDGKAMSAQKYKKLFS